LNSLTVPKSSAVASRDRSTLMSHALMSFPVVSAGQMP
jgi:hypothetical protein